MTQMLRYAGLILLFIVPGVYAGPFLELGSGYAIGTDSTMGKSCLQDWKKDSGQWGCSENPLGYAALGYQYKNFEVSVEHWSALSHYDAGLDVVSVKYRIGGR